jgi:hypothetical protein
MSTPAGVPAHDTGSRIFNYLWPRAAFLLLCYICFRLFAPAKTQAKVDFFMKSASDIMDEYNNQYDHNFDDDDSDDEDDLGKQK